MKVRLQERFFVDGLFFKPEAKNDRIVEVPDQYEAHLPSTAEIEIDGVWTSVREMRESSAKKPAAKKSGVQV